jgi:OOP family OmpA-OmpF porin
MLTLEERYMKTRGILSLLAAVSLVLGTTQTMADADQPWHLTGQIGGMKLDSGRQTRDDDVWLSVGFGRFIGNNFSLDLEYDEFSGTFTEYDTVAPGATFDQWKLSNVGLMGRYHFGDKVLRPYVAFGLGYLSYRNVGSEGDSFAPGIGVGLQGKLAKHWSMRAQLYFRGTDENDPWGGSSTYVDTIYSIGLSFDFGGKEPPPAPRKAEPPPPPPPPPNPDLDGDGVLNERDKCPNTRPGAVVDLDGCEVEAVIELEGVYFDFDKATIKPEGKVVLNEAAALLQKHERVVVEVGGHTDSVGSEAYNQGLSERRADAVRDYLMSKGVKASRLTARGYGESRPVASNDTEEGRAENRRVELVVIER